MTGAPARVVLVGFMGSGKSTIGAIVARRHVPVLVTPREVMMRLRVHLLLTALAVAVVGNMPAHAADNDALMKNAMSAAPEGVAKDATIMISDGKGGMTTLKKGTNGFTCMPDDPTTPANDPMCADENSMLWIQAYTAHAQPP